MTLFYLQISIYVLSDENVLIRVEQIFCVSPDSLALHSVTDREAAGRLSVRGHYHI